MSIQNSFFISRPGLLLVLLLWVGIRPVFGQDDTENAPILSWGSGYAAPSNATLEKVFGWGTNGFYTLRLKGNAENPSKKIFIDQFDRTLSLKNGSEINLEYRGKEREFIELLLLDGKFYLLTAYHNRHHRKNYLFIQDLDKKSLRLEKGVNKISEINSIGLTKTGDYGIKLSKDSSKILVFSDIPGKKNDSKKFGIQVFDARFNELWDKEIKLPYSQDQFFASEFDIDNQGNVYLMGVQQLPAERIREPGNPGYRYLAYAYLEEGKVRRKFKLSLEDRYITDLTFRRSGQYLICAGFYSEKSARSVKGTCLFRLNIGEEKIEQRAAVPFDFNFLTANLSAKKREKALKAEQEGNIKKQPELYRYSLDKLIPRTDGGAVLIAEQFFVEERSERDFFTGRIFIDYYYHYNDIIIANIMPSGELEWVDRIPKRQVTLNDNGYYSSYSMATLSDRFMFIFNDNERNFFEADANKLFGFNRSNAVLALSEILRDGQINISPLAREDAIGVLPRPKSCMQISKNQMLVYGERGKNYRFGILQF